jgi:probable F420-dependent oxidoreductase
MKFGVTIPNRGPLAIRENMIRLTQKAEALYFDSAWISDHIVVPRKIDPKYPYSARGEPPMKPDEAYVEPLTLMCYLAGCTQRISLGTSVLILPYRNPVFTAKIIANLDYLSNGRIIIGAGVGWMTEEFKAMGVENFFEERGAVSDEYIALFRELWTKENPSFKGKYYEVSDIGFNPKPVQKPCPPIWVGGHTKPAIRRAAALGDGWHPIGLRPPADLSPSNFADSVKYLRECAVKANRDPDTITISFRVPVQFTDDPGSPRKPFTGKPIDIAADIVQYRNMGMSHLIVDIMGSNVDALLEGMERFAMEVIPVVPKG